jgi:hypothetical protein
LNLCPNKNTPLDFGKKEKVLNYACQTYQLSRPSKVGAVMALIRECQPQTMEEQTSPPIRQVKAESLTINSTGQRPVK